MVRTDTRSSRETAEITAHIKNLNLTLKNNTFDGKDPIHVFAFFAHFLNEADMRNMSEAHEFIALPTFLEEPAEKQFRINVACVSLHGDFTWRPEAI